jgi:hypothetical protein
MADLDDLLDDEGTTGDPTFDEIGREASNQLYDRIKAGEKLPGTDLMKIVAAYFKAKEEALKQQAVEDKVYTLTDLIADVNLPKERKTELLRSEHAFLSRQLSDIEQALVGEA